MFKRALFSLLLILTVSACGKDSDNKGSGGTLNPAGLKPLTTAADCHGPDAYSINSFWTTLMTSGDINFRMNFNFVSSWEAELAVTCIAPNGSRLTARVRTPYSYTNSTITFHETRTKEERTFDMTCSATIHSATIPYHFERACLVMIDPNGQKLYLTP